MVGNEYNTRQLPHGFHPTIVVRTQPVIPTTKHIFSFLPTIYAQQHFTHFW
jgi:hypothetical protein